MVAWNDQNGYAGLLQTAKLFCKVSKALCFPVEAQVPGQNDSIRTL